MGAKKTILDRWQVSAKELTGLIDANPSLRGILLGYVAELKLRQMWFSGDITDDGKPDDHDRNKKGDHVIVYNSSVFVVECKSLQSATIKREGEKWIGKTQVDASDRREVPLPDGSTLNTTLLLRGEFDLLAVNCFAFEDEWRFVFAKNSELPCSKSRRYTKAQREFLLASLVTVTWPPEPPFHAEPFRLLDEIARERGADA